MKVLFLSLDTLRADHLSCLGNKRDLTPNLDRIATESALFTRAFATDIPTQPSHTALFTGRYGVNTGIVSHFHPPSKLDQSIPWLPSIFRDAGCATGAVDHLFAMKDWFVRGYADYMPPKGRSRSPGSVINEIAFPWLDEHAHDDFFLFLHYWDAHIPYLPPSPFKERYTAESAGRHDPLLLQQLRSRPSYPLFKRNNYDHLGDIPNLDYIADLYDAEVAYLDFEIGRLFDHLGELGILDDTLVVIFGDHGEIMTEHDAWFDHAGLYDAVTHVPLIIRAPGKVQPNTVRPMVGLVDVMPTVLSLLDMPEVPGLDGVSLRPLLEGKKRQHRAFIPLSEATWQAKRGVRTAEWKYIRCYDPGVYPRSGEELYNLADDPTEQFNLADSQPEKVAELSRLLDRWLSKQLGSRPDPLQEVVAHGLPAVARLDGIINGVAAAPPSGNPQAAGDGSVVPSGDSGSLIDEGVAADAIASNGGPVLIPVSSMAAEPVTAPLSVVEVGGGDELAARRRSRRVRTVFVAAAVLVALALLGGAINSVFLQNPVEAAGAVAPMQTANLDLATPGEITSVLVHNGEVVHKGQILAEGDAATAQEKLAADQAKLASDRQELAALSHPTSSATEQQLAAAVSTAQAQLGEAQAKVGEVTATDQQAVAAAQQKVTSDQQVLSNDQATQNADAVECTSATPPPQCETDQHQVEADQAQLTTDQAALTQAQTTQTAEVNAAQQAVTVAQAEVQQAQANEAAGTQPGTPSQVAADQAAVAADTSAVAEDQLAVAQSVLRAPFTGVVAAVGGAVGDTDTSQGVRQSAGASPVTQPATSGISIFPSPPQAQTKNTPSFAPLITLDSVGTQIVAQVPETQIGSVHLGQSAQVSLPAVPGSDFKATVTDIQPQAVNDSGSQYFLVDLSVADPPAEQVNIIPFESAGGHSHGVSAEGRLVGLSANVSF